MTRMAYTIDYGYNRPESTKTLSIPVFDFDNMSVSRETYETQNGRQRNRDFSDLTSPMDRPHTLKIYLDSVPDIYANSGIGISNQSPVKTGFKVGITDKSIAQIEEVSDSLSTSCCENSPVYAPMDVGITLKSIKHPAITASVIEQRLRDSISYLYQELNTDGSQLNQWLHGALTLTEGQSSNTVSLDLTA